MCFGVWYFLKYPRYSTPAGPHLAWRAQRPWGRRTQWGQRREPWSGWRLPAGGAGPGWCSWSFPACLGRGRAARAAGSCPAAATTGWRTAGRVHSMPPPAGSPGGRHERGTFDFSFLLSVSVVTGRGQVHSAFLWLRGFWDIQCTNMVQNKYKKTM